jgi:hypothetical protein
MRNSLLHLASAGAIGLVIAFAGIPASAKTVKECDAEYAANKDAIKGSGEKKKDFVEACRAGTETIPGGAAAPSAAPSTEAPSPAATSGVKTAKECDAEYKANKEAIKASGEKKKDFVEACRAGTETIPAGNAVAPTPAPTEAPPAPAASEGGGKTAKECNAEYKANKEAIKASGQKKKDFIEACRSGAPAPSGAAPSAAPPPSEAPATEPNEAPTPPATAAPAPAPTAAPAASERASPAAQTAPVTASEAQAQASCPSDIVVWVNTRSGIYHFKGTHNYGATKHGKYMCEAAAKAAGDRAAENEKHP